MSDFLSKAALDALVAQEFAKEKPTISAPINDDPRRKSIGVAPYAALWGGQMADLGSTLYGWKQGNVEGNSLFTGSGDNYNPHPTGKVLGTKLGVAGGMSALMALLDKKGYDKAAKVLGYVGGIGGAIPAALNTKLALKSRNKK